MPGDDIPRDLPEKLARYQAGLPGSPAEAYLIGRGLDADSAARMGFGYCQSWPQYHPSWPSHGRARLAYPLTDLHGQIVAIEGRALADVKPKSLCDGPKGAGVFTPAGLALDNLYLCEGPFDAACLASLGLSAVALCGTSIPDWLLRAVSFRHLWAAFDADASGDKAADTVAKALAKRGSVVRRMRPPREGMDWGDYLRNAKQVRLDAIWQAKGISEAVRALRADFNRLLRRIEYLQHNHRNEAHDRKTLLARVTADIEDFAARCDLEGGYTDPDDPFADESLLILRHEFEVLVS